MYTTSNSIDLLQHHIFKIFCGMTGGPHNSHKSYVPCHPGLITVPWKFPLWLQRQPYVEYSGVQHAYICRQELRVPVAGCTRNVHIAPQLLSLLPTYTMQLDHCSWLLQLQGPHDRILENPPLHMCARSSNDTYSSINCFACAASSSDAEAGA